jgi:hypothetical protein
LAVGDIVKICDDSIRRENWPIGGIVEWHSGEDGVVRVVTIRRPVVEVAKIVLNVGFVKGFLKVFFARYGECLGGL